MQNQTSSVRNPLYSKEVYEMAKLEGGFDNIDNNYYSQFINSKMLEAVKVIVGESRLSSKSLQINLPLVSVFVREHLDEFTLQKTGQNIDTKFLSQLSSHVVKSLTKH